MPFESGGVLLPKDDLAHWRLYRETSIAKTRMFQIQFQTLNQVHLSALLVKPVGRLQEQETDCNRLAKINTEEAMCKTRMLRAGVF